MSLSPLAHADSLRIGTIDFVSPDEIKVLLDIEAPDSVSLNTGTPRPFPRINGYVLSPSDQGYLVAQVEWITVERSQYPKRKGMQDFGLVDLPYPLRKMSLNPLGLLLYAGEIDGKDRYEFRRGVQAYPSVGDPVLLPTQVQLRAIVESGENRRVKIGVSPLAANAESTQTVSLAVTWPCLAIQAAANLVQLPGWFAGRWMLPEKRAMALIRMHASSCLILMASMQTPSLAWARHESLLSTNLKG